LFKNISDTSTLFLETSVEPIGTELQRVSGLSSIHISGEICNEILERRPKWDQSVSSIHTKEKESAHVGGDKNKEVYFQFGTR
jgi:hypothetical protein